MPYSLPVTLATASFLTLFGLGLAARAALGRGKYGILLGDGGHTDMIIRMRSHANFVEYVPLMLILMGLLELAGTNRTALAVSGLAMGITRVSHAVGMARPQPNPYRAAGTVGTALLLVFYAGYGLVTAFAR